MGATCLCIYVYNHACCYGCASCTHTHRGSLVPAGDEVGGVGEPLTTAVRTAADVEAAAQSAGIAHTSSGPVQVLQFSEHLNTDDIKLLELPQPVLSSLQEGDRLVQHCDNCELIE